MIIIFGTLIIYIKKQNWKNCLAVAIHYLTKLNIWFCSALGQSAPNLAAIAKGKAAAGNIVSMIKEDVDSSRKSNTGMAFSKVEGNIEFRGVCFAYPSRPNMVFEDLSFSVGAGKRFAVVGPSGSGKSTVVSMIQRFYDPTSGIKQYP